MQFGPTYIKKCPNCQDLVKQDSISSGNTFGIRHWTDGKWIAPMLPRPLVFVKCPYCHIVEWANSFDVTDSIQKHFYAHLFLNNSDKDASLQQDESIKHTKYRNLPYVKKPTHSELYQFINSKQLNSTKELNIRISVWQLENDQRRNQNFFSPLSQEGIKNLIKIIELQNELKDPYPLIKSEAYRELGRFNEAKQLIISSSFDADLNNTAKFILSLIDKKDLLVREIIC